MEMVNEQSAEVVTPAEEQSHNDAMAEHFNKGNEGLPSEDSKEEIEANMFHGMTDEWKDANLKDGKLFGKFDSIDAMAKSYQKINDERANRGSEEKASADKVTAEEAKSQVANTQLNQIAENGFNFTEDNYKAFEDAGMSKMEAENMAFKMEKAANQAYDVVGGKDNYNSLMEWAGSNLSEQEIQTFASKTVGDNFSLKDTSTMAIEWLQFKRASGGAEGVESKPTQRISGNTPQRQAEGFQSKRDYQTAMNYLRKNPTDRSAQADYESKMKATDMRNLI